MSSPGEIELTITAAKDLKNINWRNGSIRPFAVAWVDPNQKLSSRIDEEGDSFPVWEQTLIIPVPPGLRLEDQTLHIDVVHANRDGEHTKPLIGFTRLRLRDILNDAGPGEHPKRSLQLKRPSGRPQGNVTVKILIRQNSFKLMDSLKPDDVRPPSQTTGYPLYTFPAAPKQSSVQGMPFVPPLPNDQPLDFSLPSTAARPPSGYGVPYSVTPPSPGYTAQYAAPSQWCYFPQDVPQAARYPCAVPGGQSRNEYGQVYSGYGQPSSTIPGYGNAVAEKNHSKLRTMGKGLAIGAVAGALGCLAVKKGLHALENKIADD